MITILVALRDFFVALLISWLGVAGEPAEQKSVETQPQATANLALLR